VRKICYRIIKRPSLDFVLKQSDFVTVHAPLSDLTRNLIDRARIRKMKPGAFLAWSSLESRRRLVREIALNIEFFQKGKKRNRIL
jgi:hypothetical protein